MALRYALLGLLSKEPSTGYELAQRFKETMTHFWTAHHTQIYRELGKMEKEELVSSKIIHQEEYPDKKIYSIESKGYEDLIQWLARDTVGQPKLKDEQLMRVSLFHLISSKEAITYLNKTKKLHTDGLAFMERWKRLNFPDEKVPKQELGEYLTLEYGMRYMKNWIEWCDWAIEVLEKFDEE
ncbi:PadR family transcriptional regulator [Pseudalkalibacillus caeni]|uniref:PadR family transcriptional regulator n=1 Tax=Exobacillus caeni TaxID=2574798 RepID=A0A5R9EX77_9BACL|nr:PadR family transcriptional regulator [Pseudalkalibacillus caeni]TLS35677.1 PadR family transcriptional regulator [Pseudalkalibacillus caeni]